MWQHVAMLGYAWLEDTGLVLMSEMFSDILHGGCQYYYLTDAEGLFQKMASNHKGPSHFQTFIGNETSVDLSVAVPHDKGNSVEESVYCIIGCVGEPLEK